MGLSRTMLEALKLARYHTPSPIQASFIPVALEGLDVIGQAKTGTGKTAAFGIPLIEMLEPRGRGPQAIILAPTRELTQQIVVEIQKLAQNRGDVSVCASPTQGSAGASPSRIHPRPVCDAEENRSRFRRVGFDAVAAVC